MKPEPRPLKLSRLSMLPLRLHFCRPLRTRANASTATIGSYAVRTKSCVLLGSHDRVLNRFLRCESPDERAQRHSCATQKAVRSEEHTSELQSLRHLVCRLLLEKKKAKPTYLNVT